MVCAYCAGETHIINSRQRLRSNQVWRRRKCLACSAVFTTIEQIDLTRSLLVSGKSGKIMPFIPEKLFLSVYDSLKHRANAVIESKHITQTVIDKITRINSASLNSKTIAETTLVALNRFDKAASTHYRAYHF